VFKVRQYLEEDECFMLTYGDGVSNINISKLIDFHKSHGKLMTVTGARPPARFGELTLDGNKVIGFNEKPQATEGWISAGFFVCNRKVLDFLNEDESLIFEREPIERIVEAGELMVYQHTDFWHPMDNSRDYHLLNDLWNHRKAPWKIWA
jgi:glucose-1-phosphate cytidylyltransferase